MPRIPQQSSSLPRPHHSLERIFACGHQTQRITPPALCLPSPRPAMCPTPIIDAKFHAIPCSLAQAHQLAGWHPSAGFPLYPRPKAPLGPLVCCSRNLQTGSCPRPTSTPRPGTIGYDSNKPPRALFQLCCRGKSVGEKAYSPEQNVGRTTGPFKIPSENTPRAPVRDGPSVYRRAIRLSLRWVAQRTSASGPASPPKANVRQGHGYWGSAHTKTTHRIHSW